MQAGFPRGAWLAPIMQHGTGAMLRSKNLLAVAAELFQLLLQRLLLLFILLQHGLEICEDVFLPVIPGVKTPLLALDLGINTLHYRHIVIPQAHERAILRFQMNRIGYLGFGRICRYVDIVEDKFRLKEAVDSLDKAFLDADCAAMGTFGQIVDI